MLHNVSALVLFICWDDCVTFFDIQNTDFIFAHKRSAYWMIAKIIFSSVCKYQCLAVLSLWVNERKTLFAASVFQILLLF